MRRRFVVATVTDFRCTKRFRTPPIRSSVTVRTPIVSYVIGMAMVSRRFGSEPDAGRGVPVAVGAVGSETSCTCSGNGERVMDLVVAAARSDRHEAICAAVFELLGEVGYDRMSMDAVAAGPGPARRPSTGPGRPSPTWSRTHSEYYFGETPAPPDAGSLRGDLLALMETRSTASWTARTARSSPAC